MAAAALDWFMLGMGGLALSFFWIHLLLIAAAATLDARTLRSRARRFGRPTRARIEGDLRLVIAQVGRSKGDGKIHVHDRAAFSRHEGLVFHHADGTNEVVAADLLVDYWPSVSRLRDASACPDRDAFDLVYEDARRARGHEREIFIRVPTEQTVFVTREGPSAFVVSDDPPAAFVRTRTLLVFGFVLLVFLLLGGCTVAVCWPPLFGTVGKIGALAAVGGHQLLQLLGKHVRDAMRPPSRATVGGTWVRPTVLHQ